MFCLPGLRPTTTPKNGVLTVRFNGQTSPIIYIIYNILYRRSGVLNGATPSIYGIYITYIDNLFI
jgi:hypothetical protein